MRTFIERALRNTSVKRRLPSGAAIWVSPDSQLKYLRRNDFDRDLVDLAKKHVRSDSIVWDIGANCGVFAFSALSAKAVVAVEADPFLCHLLQRSAAGNASANITILPAAVSDSTGLAEFAIAARGRASNYLVEFQGRSQTGGVRSTLLVPTITLDAMLEQLAPPTFVKIDVEGAEAGVLRGAVQLMQKHRPMIYVEVGKAAASECRALFDRFSYSVSGDSNWLAVPR